MTRMHRLAQAHADEALVESVTEETTVTTSPSIGAGRNRPAQATIATELNRIDRHHHNVVVRGLTKTVRQLNTVIADQNDAMIVLNKRRQTDEELDDAMQCLTGAEAMYGRAAETLEGLETASRPELEQSFILMRTAFNDMRKAFEITMRPGWERRMHRPHRYTGGTGGHGGSVVFDSYGQERAYNEAVMHQERYHNPMHWAEAAMSNAERAQRAFDDSHRTTQTNQEQEDG